MSPGTENVGFRTIVLLRSFVSDVLPRAVHAYVASDGSSVTEQSSVKSAVLSYTSASLHVMEGTLPLFASTEASSSPSTTLTVTLLLAVRGTPEAEVVMLAM